MKKTAVIIMGIPLNIRYNIHEPSYVEWNLDLLEKSANPPDNYDEMELLNILLRTHYCNFIESACRENAFYENYAATQAADDWADSLRYVKTATCLFEDNEDISF